ncbi:hypothetical protein [Piscinibacter gummiphilus]|uniref:Copper resistance protein D domain-containing protein n=1 Tax=Piscinibacter gummiphilus TaxID=946333 RepID=A0ABZ0CM99_9BURK|nr:hypothetical protein [Piscinibacter gummiphilus]WOB06107.1 hypothetical protein RXV79_14360 [Piscinibacter gummiphilus]
MSNLGSQALIAGAALSAAAALAHLACIVLGAPAYRVMGAGERIARAVEARKLQPALVTLTIAVMLFGWSAYALSGAGVIGALPLTKLALVLISGIYLGRALAFPLLKPMFAGNSDTFWWVSSALCGAMGALHAFGTLAQWHVL